MKTFLLLILTTLSLSSLAQNSSRTKTSAIRKPYSEVTFGYVNWQEKMEVTALGVPGFINANFQGFKLGYAYNKPFYKVRWVQHFEANLQFGSHKAKGIGDISDEIEKQSWYAGSFNPGVTYRTTARSEILLSAPFTLKQPKWNFKEMVEVENQPFSMGLQATFMNRINIKSSISMSVAHMVTWESTVWGLNYHYDFRSSKDRY